VNETEVALWLIEPALAHSFGEVSAYGPGSASNLGCQRTINYRYVWSAAEMQAKNEEWQMVCANVFGLEWSQRLRAMMDVRSLSSL